MGFRIIKIPARTLQPGKSEKVPFLHFPEFFEGVGENFSTKFWGPALLTAQGYRMSYCSQFSVQALRL
jgi:hypothetical protein